MEKNTNTKTTNRVNLSFKNNDRDNDLYRFVAAKNDKSAFIKDCIEFYLCYHNQQPMQQPIQQPIQQTMVDGNIGNEPVKETRKKIKFNAKN